MRRIVMSGLVALAAVLGSAGAADAAPAPAVGTVNAIATPAGVRAEAAGTDAFVSVGSQLSCGSPTSCLAVGTSGDDPAPVLQAWNGTAWRSVAVTAPKGTRSLELTAVSCLSATFCLVTGADVTTVGDRSTVAPYAMTWNGTSLTPTAGVPVPKGDSLLLLTAVSCMTVKSCVAVGAGSRGTAAGGTTLMVVASWNGATWALRTARNLGGATETAPSSIRCFSVTSCVISGTSSFGPKTEKMLFATWNGTVFTAMKAAVPAGAKIATTVTDMSCNSPARCVATGLSSSSAGTSGFGFAEVLNGTSWKADKIAWPKADTESFLFGVSCVTQANCIAVGAAATSKSGEAKALSYNGTTWSQLSVPGPGKGQSSVFSDVRCPKANDCLAFGVTGPTSGKITTPLSGMWNGTSWKLAVGS